MLFLILFFLLLVVNVLISIYLNLEIENQENFQADVIRPADTTEVSKSIAEIYKEIEKEWHRRQFETPIAHVRVVLEEAVFNAWKHGSLLNPDKAITIRHRFGNDFHLEVIDEGVGFDYTHLPDPTLAKNITQSHGRGIFLINYYSDAVTWKGDGNHILMSFRKHPVRDGQVPKMGQIDSW